MVDASIVSCDFLLNQLHLGLERVNETQKPPGTKCFLSILDINTYISIIEGRSRFFQRHFLNPIMILSPNSFLDPRDLRSRSTPSLDFSEVAKKGGWVELAAVWPDFQTPPNFIPYQHPRTCMFSQRRSSSSLRKIPYRFLHNARPKPRHHHTRNLPRQVLRIRAPTIQIPLRMGPRTLLSLPPRHDIFHSWNCNENGL